MEKNKEVVIILKNPGTTCNIGCTYCAEARKKVVTIDNKITIEDIKILMSKCPDNSNITILFHGGEPTILPVSYYEEIIEYCRKINSNIAFGLQTNATLLSEDWISFILKHKDYMGVSVSLDGVPVMNDYRRDKQGKETFSTVEKNIRLLGESNIRIGVISTLTNIALGHERDLAELIAKFNNIRFVKLNPCFDLWSTGEVPKWGITPVEYSNFVKNFFDIMLENNLFSRVNVEPILSIIKKNEGIESSFCNYSSKKCTNFISLYPDGLITTCDNYNTEEGLIGSLYKIDSIFEIKEFQSNKELEFDLQELMEDCKQCSQYDLCTGGCLAVRRRYNKYYKANGKELYCRAMKEMIDHITKNINWIRGEKGGSNENIGY